MSATQADKVVLVTGASRGIGLALVRRYKSQGWRVAACSGSEKILAVREADHAAVCDVTQAAEVSRFVADTVAKLGRIDVLINNAGLAGENSMEAAASDEFWQEVRAKSRPRL